MLPGEMERMRENFGSNSIAVWKRFEEVLRKRGIPGYQLPWYKLWCERFGRFLKGRRLMDATSADVHAFIESLTAVDRVSGSQVEQAELAVRLFLQHVTGEGTEAPAVPTHNPDTAPVSEGHVALSEVTTIEPEEGSTFGEHLGRAQYSPRTVQAYLDWGKRYREFCCQRKGVGEEASAVRSFLLYLETQVEMAPASLRQAQSAMKVYLRMKGVDGNWPPIPTAQRSECECLPPADVERLLERLAGANYLVVALIYGTGMLLSEVLRVRVKDIDFEKRQICLHGRTKRFIHLPTVLDKPLREQVSKVTSGAQPLEEKKKEKPIEPQERGPFLFLSPRFAVDPKTRQVVRSHIHPTLIQKALQRASVEAGLDKTVTCQMLRSSYAVSLLSGGHDVRAVQDALGHRNISSTLRYVKKSGESSSLPSPLDAFITPSQERAGG